jgi:hypothetical protein
MRTPVTAFFAVLFTTFGFSQSSDFKWQSSLSDSRVFVENKGQFNHFIDDEVLYAIDGGQCVVLFTNDGYTIRLTRKVKNEDRVRFDRSKPRYIQQTETISVRFGNSNDEKEVVALSQVGHTSTYAMLNADRSESQISGIAGFEELVYRNVYPNIDVRFTIHPQGGFKYDVVLHPGADPSNVKLLYPSAHKPYLDAEGNLLVSTTFGNIIDHAPTTTVKSMGKVLASSFKVNGTEVGFELTGFDSSQETVIDPWVLTPAFPNSGGIWDIDTDDLGNVYIYGGDTPMKLQKYNSAGALQWTYNTPWDSANYWIGTMITEPISGDCFITAGTDPRIQRISTAGSMDWNANGGAFDEYWKFSFNCDNTRLFLGGTRLTLGGALIEGYGYVFEIDMNNGAQLNNVEVASVSPGPLGLVNNPNEVRAMCPSPNGNYYYMTLDTIGRFDENLTLGYQDNHGYGFSYQVAGYGVTNQSINAMAATTDYLYTLDGSTLDKRNIVDGSIIISVPIPNGQTTNELGFNSVENGGLELDSCGNVYVGSTTGVYKFDENLVQLAFQSTPGRVYDVDVNSAGEVVACGQGFLASLNLAPCAPPKAICLNCLELTPAGPFCPDDDAVTLIADPGNGIWSGPGIVDEILGIFDPSVADTGTHVIYFAPEIPLVCGIDSLIIEVNYCVDLQACIDSLGNIAVPNGIPPYTWSQTIDTVDCSGCFPAAPPFIQPCSIPPGCAVPTTVVQVFSTDETVAPTGNWPIFVEDSEGNTLEIPSLASLPACSQGCFIVANLPDTVVACLGDSAQATVQVTGAIGNVTYSWNTNPVQTTQTAIDLVPGNWYMVTVTDDSSCVAMDSTFVVEEECVGPIVCATPFGDMQAEGIGPFTWYEYTESTDCSGCIEFPGFPPCSFPPGCAVTVQEYQQFAVGDMATPTGNWPVAVVDAAGDTLFINSLAELPLCTETCYIQVDVPESAFTCFSVNDAEVTATVTGAFGNVTYGWNTNPIQTTQTATGLGAGEYVVTVTDANLCEATDTVVVVQNPELTLQVTGTDSLCLGVTVGSATASASGGAGNFLYSWDTNPVQGTITANNLSVGTYNVTVTDDVGCTETASWTIEERPSVIVDVTSGGDVCLGSTDGSATASASNGLAPYSYSWNTSPVQTGTNATNLAPGGYQVTATDQDGCQGIGNVTVGALPAVEAEAGMYTTICLGQSATLIAGGGVDYQWSSGQSGETVLVSPEETTLYTVTVTDANNCTATDTVTVFVVPIPQVTIEELDSVICDVEPPFMIVGIPPGGTFSGNGVSPNGFFEPLVAGDGAHTITYSFASIENCEVDTSVVIVVDEELCDVSAPSIFNPNSQFEGDMDFCGNQPQNNVFSLPCLEWYPGNRVLIYDRWGRKCYEQEDYHLKPWDGGNQSTGVYYYIVEVPNEEVVKGFFHLVR